MEALHSYKVWGLDSCYKFENAIKVDAQTMPQALDAASETLGYVDYADLMQTLGLDSEKGDGLNIIQTR
jgi:hypothetical protein